MPTERDLLCAEIDWLLELLANTPEDAVIDRMSLEARLSRARSLLAKVGESVKTNPQPTVKERDFLLSEIAWLQEMLADEPEENVINRASLEARLVRAKNLLVRL